MAANSGQSPHHAPPSSPSPYNPSAIGPASTEDVAGPSQQAPAQPYGLEVWLEQRKQWRLPTASAKPPKRDPVIAPTVAYEDLLLTSETFEEPIPLPVSNPSEQPEDKPFAQAEDNPSEQAEDKKAQGKSVALKEMVEFLVDAWIQDGYFD